MARSVAIVGASSNPAKFGHKAVGAYLRRGWEVYPVNPAGGEIAGRRVYRGLAELPERPERVSLYVPPAIGRTLLPEIAALRPAELYVNPGAESAELVAEARRLGLEPILACSIVAIGESPE